MARTQSKKRRLLGFAKTANSTASLALPPGRLQARAGDVGPVSETSGMTSLGMFARMKRFFHRSNKGLSTTIATEAAGTVPCAEAQGQGHLHHAGLVQEVTVDTDTGGGTRERREGLEVTPIQDTKELTNRLEPEPATAEIGKDVDAAVKAFDDMGSMSRIGKGAVDAVGRANSAVIEAQNMSDTYLKPFKVFNQVVTTLTNVHPYARIALVVLTFASQLFIHHANLDNAVSDLLDTVRQVYEFLSEPDTLNYIENMKDTLVQIARVISESAQFVKNYFETKSFWLRAKKNVFSETQTIVNGYVKTLDSLMQQYRDRAVRDTRVNTYRIFEDLSLEGMAYADGASFNTTKKCLDGTRTEILQEIIDWINDPDVNAPRILWLHGQAGRGKSAIAHTIASWIKDAGGLGSCFCFARDRHAERHQEKILTTIARDLADRDPAFRRALADIVAKDRSLWTTPDVMQQWQHLILEPLCKVNGAIVGNVVVVIDALDESGPDTSREHILHLLTSKEAARLPSSFRIFLTSRPLPDIEWVLRVTSHVKTMSLDDIPEISVEHDIELYVSSELGDLREIGATEIQNITWKSDGLFEWARLACGFIRPNRPGRTVRDRYNEIMSPHVQSGGTLLDFMYSTILGDTVPEDDITLARFRSVMQQIISMSVPQQMGTLNEMRSHFPSEEDHFDIIIILEFMAPLLSGIVDRCSVVRPLHASFYDFLTDHSRSGVYCVGVSSTGMESALAFTSLHTLCKELKFNICGLDSSYCCNSEVVDLQDKINRNIGLNLSYSCRYWANHLQKVVFESGLAMLVKMVVGSEKILFWLETLSLISGLGQATSALASAISWLQGQDGFEETLASARDGITFVQNFGGVISHSTPHLYISALPFTPSNTVFARMFVAKF